MAKLVQFGQEKTPKIDPELKEFIDRVIVPILVNEYLDQLSENRLADRAEDVALFPPMKGLLADVEVPR